jgi:hypothetical protein
MLIIGPMKLGRIQVVALQRIPCPVHVPSECTSLSRPVELHAEQFSNVNCYYIPYMIKGSALDGELPPLCPQPI